MEKHERERSKTWECENSNQTYWVDFYKKHKKMMVGGIVFLLILIFCAIGESAIDLLLKYLWF